MYIYNWYHSGVTGIHHVHGLVTVHCRVIPLLFASPFLHSLLLPIRFPLLTWNPPCCDRIRPPRSQVARKLNSPFPSPCSYTPHSKIPTPPGFPRSKYTLIRTTSRIWLTRSSTPNIGTVGTKQISRRLVGDTGMYGIFFSQNIYNNNIFPDSQTYTVRNAMVDTFLHSRRTTISVGISKIYIYM
jgi:hypothetical protein